MEILDDLYKHRLKQWQSLIDLHNLQFDEKIRDLDASEVIRVPVFYTCLLYTSPSPTRPY